MSDLRHGRIGHPSLATEGNRTSVNVSICDSRREGMDEKRGVVEGIVAELREKHQLMDVTMTVERVFGGERESGEDDGGEGKGGGVNEGRERFCE